MYGLRDLKAPLLSYSWWSTRKVEDSTMLHKVIFDLFSAKWVTNLCWVWDLCRALFRNTTQGLWGATWISLEHLFVDCHTPEGALDHGFCFLCLCYVFSYIEDYMFTYNGHQFYLKCYIYQHIQESMHSLNNWYIGLIVWLILWRYVSSICCQWEESKAQPTPLTTTTTITVVVILLTLQTPYNYTAFACICAWELAPTHTVLMVKMAAAAPRDQKLACAPGIGINLGAGP